MKSVNLIGSIAVCSLIAGIGFFALGRPPRNESRRPGRSNVLLRPEIQPSSHDRTTNPNIESSTNAAPSNGSETRGLAVSTAAHESAVNATNTNSAESWSRFRGPNGTGVSHELEIPTQWDDHTNLLWATELPGAGSSSPVLTDKYVFVTSYSGYGEEKRSSSKIDQLERQLNCIDRVTGKLIWSKSTKAVMPEDPYQGMGMPEHGYSTNTPVTDGETVFAFFGKSGVFAYDLKGNQLWQASVGTESGNRGWGTASSLILYKDLVIVNASEESQALIALDKKTGKTIWSAPASILELAYGTPVIAQVDKDRDDLVIAVPGEVWGLNPNTGKLVWFVETTLTGNLSPSVVIDEDKIYVFGGYRSSGSLAIQLGGTGNVTKSHILWTSRNSSYVVTPVLHEGNLYWIDDQGMYFCVSAKTGDLIEKKRVTGIRSGGRPVYASPISISGKIYLQSRNSGLFVIAGEPSLNVLQQNKFASDDSVFNATPAVSQGQLFLRSYSKLYCVGKQTKGSGQ